MSQSQTYFFRFYYDVTFNDIPDLVFTIIFLIQNLKRKNHNELYDQAKRNRTVITNNTLVQAKN